MMGGNQRWYCRLFVMVSCLTIFVTTPVLAQTDDDGDGERFLRLWTFVRDSFEYPASQTKDLNRALALRKRMVEELQSESFKSISVQQQQGVHIWEALRNEGNVLKQLGRYKEAADAYLQAQSEYTKYGSKPPRDCRIEVAQIYVEGKMYDEATKTFDELIASGDSQQKKLARIGLVDIHEKQGKRGPTGEKEEEKTFLQTCKFVKESLEYPAVEAQSHGEFERALALRKRAVEELTAITYQSKSIQDSQYFDVYSNVSAQVDILKSLRRAEEGIQAYTQATDMRDKHFGQTTDRRRAIGGIYAACGMVDKAIEKYEDVAKSDKVLERYGAHIALSQTYLDQKNLKLAEKQLTDMLDDKQIKESPRLLRGCRVWLQNYYARQKRAEDEKRMLALLDDRHCPKCGSDKNVIRIVYGRSTCGSSASTEEVEQGGCCWAVEAPGWRCKTDQVTF